MEEEDEIVKEVDVYLNQNLTKELFLFQYPLRPVYRPQNTNESDHPRDSLSRLTSFKIKPKFHKMQMEYKLDNHSANFDEDCELLFDVGNGGKAAEEFTTVLSSSKVPTRTNYAVGILRDRELHLTPLRHVIQFRPSFSHIDENDNKKKKREEKMETDENEENMNVDKEMEKETESLGSDLKPIQVQFKKKDIHNQNPKVLAQRRKSLLKQQEAEEPFQEYTYKDSHTEDSYTELEKLFYSADEVEGMEPTEVVIPAPATVAAYLDLINPQPSDAYAQPTQSKQVPLHTLRKQSVEKQVYHLLVNAVVIKFDTVLDLAVGYSSESEILQALEKYGILIRGLWTLKSEFCFESKKMRLIRDFLLCLLAQHDFVQRKEFMKHVGRFISNEGAKDLLETVAVHYSAKDNNNSLSDNNNKPAKGWTLKQPPDLVFQLKYPAITEKYNMYWKDQLKTITESLAALWNASKEAPIPQKVATAPVRPQQQQQQQVSAQTTASTHQVTASTASGNQNQTILFLKEMFQTYGVCSFQLLKQNLIKRQHEKSGALAGVTDDMLRAGLNDIAVSLHNAYFLKTLDNPSMDKFRDVIIGLFKQKVSLKRSNVAEACQAALGEPIPQPTYTKIINELAYSKGSTWIFKSGSGAD